MTAKPGPPSRRPGEAVRVAPAAAKRRGSRRTVGLVVIPVLGIVVAVAAGLVVRAVLPTPDRDLSTAEAGDCLTRAEDIADVRVVDCDADDAVYRVLAKTPGWTESDFDRVLRGEVPVDELCGGRPIPAGGEPIWYGEKTSDGSGTGDVFCLEPLTATP